MWVPFEKNMEQRAAINKCGHYSIVLVAGLGGHPKGTWLAADGTLWPRQLLPDYVKNIRVLSFNYNNTLKGSASQAGIEEHAEDLLIALFNAKEDEDEKLRPVVFVGHSLGGLIIKHVSGRVGHQYFIHLTR